MSDKYQTIAKAVRLEVDENTDDVYIVFKIVSEKYKQSVRVNWDTDLEFLVINNTELILKDD